MSFRHRFPCGITHDKGTPVLTEVFIISQSPLSHLRFALICPFVLMRLRVTPFPHDHKASKFRGYDESHIWFLGPYSFYYTSVKFRSKEAFNKCPLCTGICPGNAEEECSCDTGAGEQQRNIQCDVGETVVKAQRGDAYTYHKRVMPE